LLTALPPEYLIGKPNLVCTPEFTDPVDEIGHQLLGIAQPFLHPLLTETDLSECFSR
jgi:hypothetical protein